MRISLKMHPREQFFTFLAIVVGFWTRQCFASPKSSFLSARNLLETIAPTHHLAKLPPGFPSLHGMNTDKFNYSTAGRFIRVKVGYDSPVVMFKRFVILNNVKMNFTYDKKQKKNGSWRFSGAGSLQLGETNVPVDVGSDGGLTASVNSLPLRDIADGFHCTDGLQDADVMRDAIVLKNVTMTGSVGSKNTNFSVQFRGTFTLGNHSTTSIIVYVTKRRTMELTILSIIDVQNASPASFLQQIVSNRTRQVPFISHLLANSELLSQRKRTFSIAIALGDVYNHTINSTNKDAADVLLKSHIPSGLTLLCPFDVDDKSKERPIKTAFVMRRPTFDLLIDRDDKILIKKAIDGFARQFKPPTLPDFLSKSNAAFTSHISFNASTSVLTIFVRLTHEERIMASPFRLRASNGVLQVNVSAKSGRTWVITSRGTLRIGSTRFRVRCVQLPRSDNKAFAMDGVADKFSMQDLIDEFNPTIYPDDDSKQMVENMETNDVHLNRVNLFSRVNDNNTQHILFTGYTTLSAWEKDIQVALLLLSVKGQWILKMAVSFMKSPLSNLLQALTGFDSREISVLHNSHIMTTMISSPTESFKALPPKIITTPLLRLPVAKGINIIALIKLPDNCGDDKLCQSLSKLLKSGKVFTLKGLLSLSGFTLAAVSTETIDLGDNLEAVNSTLQFDIGNKSRVRIEATLVVKHSDMSFHGYIHIYRTGQIQLEMTESRKRWSAPFGLNSLAFENLKLLTFYDPEKPLRRLKLEGNLKIGAIGNGAEINAPVYLNYDPEKPSASTFHANVTVANLTDLMAAFTMTTELPFVLRSVTFPEGLMVSYSSLHKSESRDFELHGDATILGRTLNCNILITHPGRLTLTTVNSPAPVILGDGQLIIQKDEKNRLRGPKISATVDHSIANVTLSGFVKILGIDTDTDVTISDQGLRFNVKGKLLGFKDTNLDVFAGQSLENIKVSGCFSDIADSLQFLLVDIISRAANQSTTNMKKAEHNLFVARDYYEQAEQTEVEIRNRKVKMRRTFEEHLVDYGRFEVQVNDSCRLSACEQVCFGCPGWNHCCRRDIFGECVSCSTWKKCCWQNEDPLCIAEHDGCHVIRTVAEKDLNSKQAQIIRERMDLDAIEQLVTDAEINKGKHKAVLEAASDAKRLVIEDSGPGLNAADAERNFGPVEKWIHCDSVCYNTTLSKASSGCMQFFVRGRFYKGISTTVSISSCLKDDLIPELSESMANYIFPGIVDTSVDDISDVSAESNTTSDTPSDVVVLEKKHSSPSHDGKSRRRRSVPSEDTANEAHEDNTRRFYQRSLFANPFWDIKTDRSMISTRSKIPMEPQNEQIMDKMINQRWKIPENKVGRCHIFHQLTNICKDIGDTLVHLGKEYLKTSRKFQKERSKVMKKVHSTGEFLSTEADRVQLKWDTLPEIQRTLEVVHQGVDTWANKCQHEMDWQDGAGVQGWLSSMDLRIQDMGGFGVFRFLENLFHAFDALFESSAYSDSTAAEALELLQRIRRVSTGFEKIFKERLSITGSQSTTLEVLREIELLQKATLFCPTD